MGAHDEGVESRGSGQIQSDGRRLPALLAGTIERLAHSPDVRRAAREGFGDRGVDVFCAVGVEQAGEIEGRVADVATALGDDAEQLATVGDGLVQPIEVRCSRASRFHATRASTCAAFSI